MFARAADEIHRAYASNPEFGAYFIVWQDASYTHPSAGYCDQVRRQNGLTMPVLIWPDAQKPVDVGLDERHWNYVMARGAKIVFKKQFDDDDFRAAIQQLLAE